MEQVLRMMCAHTWTASALHRRIGVLQAALERVLFAQDRSGTIAESIRSYLQEHADAEDAKVMCAWEDAFWERFTAEALNEAITDLRGKAEALPLLTLYVPAELDENALSSLCTWVRSEMHTDALLELHVDPNTIGGCALIANDQYHDLSFHAALARRSGIITELLNTYA